MIKQKLEADLKKVVSELDFETDDIFVSISSNPSFGDYSSNIALQLSKQNSSKNNQTPSQIAKLISDKLQNLSYLDKIEVAGAGFLNFFFNDQNLIQEMENFPKISKNLISEKILVEYGHVNPLKEIHIGHLRTFILGESICRSLEAVGNIVFRANYQGDIGLHIAKAIWGIEQVGFPNTDLTLEEKANFLGKAYARGNKAYEEDQAIKAEITQISTALYRRDPKFSKVYHLAREWSLAYFEPVYELLNITYDKCFFESEVFEDGKEIVEENIGKIFKKDNGAVIFEGEKYGFHTRVFITSEGNPTYEAKEVGLAKLEHQTFAYDKSIHVVAREQEGYFHVVIKAIELLFPDLQGKKQHLSYGFVDLKGGKMSSRTGNVITVDNLNQIVTQKVRELIKTSDQLENNNKKLEEQIAWGAIKFAYLKFSPSVNMVFDLEKSVSLEGDSGPYVQYTYARARSVLGNNPKTESHSNFENLTLEAEERLVLTKLSYFDYVVSQAARESRPNLICEYLLDLSKSFNLFYQKHRIIGSEKVDFRVKLTQTTSEVLKKGLGLLGIEAPEKM